MQQSLSAIELLLTVKGKFASLVQYYQSRVQQIKREKPKVWWKEVKRLTGLQSRSGDLLDQINVEEIENLTMEKANAINNAFFEPLEGYRLHTPPAKLALEENPEFLQGD